jgi:peroxiredoxin family protein
MTLTLEPPTAAVDPIARAINDLEPAPEPAAEDAGGVKGRDFVIICYSGDLEKTWASLILATTAAASGVRTKMFLTFWGLQTFVRDEKRITGETWMQKMLAVMQRPGVSHRKLSKMNFLGMGPWMMGSLARKYNVASPKELLEAAQALGVEFMPCQMTMDMFGRRRDRHRAAQQRRGVALHLTEPHPPPQATGRRVLRPGKGSTP